MQSYIKTKLFHRLDEVMIDLIKHMATHFHTDSKRKIHNSRKQNGTKTYSKKTDIICPTTNVKQKARII